MGDSLLSTCWKMTPYLEIQPIITERRSSRPQRARLWPLFMQGFNLPCNEFLLYFCLFYTFFICNCTIRIGVTLCNMLSHIVERGKEKRSALEGWFGFFCPCALGGIPGGTWNWNHNEHVRAQGCVQEGNAHCSGDLHGLSWKYARGVYFLPPTSLWFNAKWNAICSESW